MSILQKLVNIDLLKEIWKYLTTNEICRFLEINKYFRNISIKINEIIPQKMIINFYNSCQINRRPLAIKKIFNNFPIIYNLSLNIHDVTNRECLFALCNIVSACNNIKELNITISDDEMINDDGTNVIFNQLNHVTVLDISYSSISSINTLNEICFLTNITSFNINHCQQLNNQGLSPLSKMTSLKYLYMEHCTGISNNGLHYLTTLTNLEHLDLSYCINQISEHGLIYLSNLINLKFLKLRSVRNITSLSFLATLINLTSLDLSYCRYLNNENFSSISYLTNLSCLNLIECDLTDDNLSNLSNLTNLTFLNLSFNMYTKLSFLNSLVNITNLDLGINKDIADEELKSILNLTNLNRLSIDHYGELNDTGLLILKSIPNVSTLIIHNVESGLINHIHNGEQCYDYDEQDEY